MNIQTRKLALIEEFIRISDENLLTKIESFVLREKKKSIQNELQPMSLTEFYELIDQARQDADAGRLVSHDELAEKVKGWQ
jgi:hypothetical protein